MVAKDKLDWLVEDSEDEGGEVNAQRTSDLIFIRKKTLLTSIGKR